MHAKRTPLPLLLLLCMYNPQLFALFLPLRVAWCCITVTRRLIFFPNLNRSIWALWSKTKTRQREKGQKPIWRYCMQNHAGIRGLPMVDCMRTRHCTPPLPRNQALYFGPSWAKQKTHPRRRRRRRRDVTAYVACL